MSYTVRALTLSLLTTLMFHPQYSGYTVCSLVLQDTHQINPFEAETRRTFYPRTFHSLSVTITNTALNTFGLICYVALILLC